MTVSRQMFNERIKEDARLAICNRYHGEPEVACIIELSSRESVELLNYGNVSYRWAFCRDHQPVRWIYDNVLEMDLIRALVNTSSAKFTFM